MVQFLSRLGHASVVFLEVIALVWLGQKALELAARVRFKQELMVKDNPAAGVTASWIASAGLPGTKVAAPGRRLSCTMWKTGIRCARAQRRVSAMRATALGPSGSTTFPIGAKYSCWASMMMSAVFSIARPRSFSG